MKGNGNGLFTKRFNFSLSSFVERRFFKKVLFSFAKLSFKTIFYENQVTLCKKTNLFSYN